MPVLALPRPDLFDQGQVATILSFAANDGKKFHRHTVGDLAPRIGLRWKADPCRPRAKMLGRSDVDRVAAVFGLTVDWDAVMSA